MTEAGVSPVPKCQGSGAPIFVVDEARSLDGGWSALLKLGEALGEEAFELN